MPGPDDASRLPSTPSLADTNATGGEATLTTPALPGDGPCRYVLGGEVARGGMGVVYRATDTHLGREVAVKVLQGRFGPDSAAARRFADEARITAQLQHPGIPPAYDLGTLPDGRPFLAMKLIKGDTLGAMLAARPDPSHDRGRFVAAFEQACQAVAYAHAHGVVHRDLKPANIMVGSFAEVQVMDWGLAKVLGHGRPGCDDDPGRTTAETEVRSPRDGEGAVTQAGSVLGTPAFMPPEQAIGAVDQIDARSDVFGLGGILAAVLTGRPPFLADTAEATRQLAAKGRVEDCFARLDSCGADPELVALCKRCLAPEKEGRPADAGAVARAVAGLRAAADERARLAELGRAEAAVREAEGRRRRRLWLGLAAALAAGLVASSGLAVWADTARKAAEKAKGEAEEQTQLANAVKDFLKYDVLQLADPETQQQDGKLAYDAGVKLRDVVLRASRAIEGKFVGQPLVEAELRLTLGYTLLGMGRSDLAGPQTERSWDIYVERLGPDHPDTLRSMNALAVSYAALGRTAEALQLLGRTLELRKARLGPDHPDTLASMNNLANGYAALGRDADALQLREQILALREAKLGPDNPDTLNSMNALAVSYAALGRAAEALKLFERTHDLRKARLGPDHPDTLGGMTNLAIGYAALGRDADALKLFERTLDLQKAKLGPHHPDTLASMNNLANGYAALGRDAEALQLRERTLELRKARLGPDHPDTLISMTNLAVSYAALGRAAEALKLFGRTHDLQKAILGPDHPDSLDSARHVITTLVALERPNEVLPLIDEVLSLADRATAKGKTPHPDLKPAMVNYRLRIFQDRKDARGYRQAAEMYEKLGRRDAGGLYDAACYRAVLAGLLAADPTAAKAEADRAMAWLTKAVAAGYRDRAHMQKDPDLHPLRGREDLKKLVEGLPELLKMPRKDGQGRP